MLQTILDLYPDAISQFGIAGCAFATLESIGAAAALLLWARYFTRPARRPLSNQE